MITMEFNFKKHICIILGIILLVANTQIFSQEETIISDIISKQEIEELSHLANRIRIGYNMTLKNITQTSNLISGTSAVKYDNPYTPEIPISNSYKVYYEQINKLAQDLQSFQSKMRETYGRYIDALPEGTYLKKVTANYINGKMNTLFEMQNRYLEKLLSISDIIIEHPPIEDISPIIKNVYFHSLESRHEYLKQQYMKDSKLRNLFIKDLADYQTYYQKVFSQDMQELIRQLEKAQGSFSRETVEFFSHSNHTAEEVVRYFETHLPQKQQAVLLALRLSDEGTNVGELIKHIQLYVNTTNKRLLKLDKLSEVTLGTALSKMKPAQRVEHVSNILDFSPETLALKEEIKQAEKTVGKKIVSRSSIKLSGPFMAISAVLVASSIVTVNANNNFYKSIGPYELAQIKRKINNGEIVPLQELSAYYTDERNLAEIQKDPRGLFEVFEIAITINDCLDALNVDKSPHNPAAQERKVKKLFNQYLEKLDLEKATSEIGTI